MPTVEQLLAMVVERDRLIEELRERVADLERQLGHNSRNSSRPPSGDRLNRSLSRAQQRKAERKPGKQPCGKGFAFRRAETADDSHHWIPDACGGCGGDLSGAESVKVAARQVIDLPEEIAVAVFEHRLHSVRCGCGHIALVKAPPSGLEPETCRF
jgi:hypothetical protein